MRRTLLLLVVLMPLLGGCAWSNRANRPVWNAFESHLVPESDGAFYATLPVTVPAGLVAIFADTFVVHPAQVADDAWGDAGDLWRGIPWSDEYYTQLALLPLRAVGTPLLFTLSFLGRSCFDLSPRSPADDEADATRDGAARPADGTPASRDGPARSAVGEIAPRPAAEEALLAAFRRVAGGATRRADLELPPPPPAWTEALQSGYAEALSLGTARGRLALMLYVREHALAPALADVALGLRDPDAVVRHEMLRTLTRPDEVPAGVRAALRDDSSDMVRTLARELWP